MAPNGSKELSATSESNGHSRSEEEEASTKLARYQKEAAAIVNTVGPLTFAIVTGGQLLNQSRPALVRRITSNQAQAAEMLAAFAGYGGALEFAVNPIIGRLSDRFGRRPLLLLSPVCCCFLRAMVAAFPSSSTVIMFERMMSSAVVTGFFSTMRAMLNDKLEGKDLVVAQGSIAAWAGSGVIIGPYIEVLILKYLGARANFVAVAALNAVVGLIMYKVAKETLPVEDRKPMTIKDCSPFTFVEMCQVSSANRRMMFILLLQSFGEARIMQDINMLNLRENLSWNPGEISTFQSMLGVSVFTGGKTVKMSLDKFGMYGHTKLSNLAMALAFYVQSLGGPQNMPRRYLTQYIALSLWFVGGRKRDAIETLCTAETLDNTGMGKGQVASALSNFKSLGAVFGPPVSARAYTYGLENGWLGLPYVLISLLHLLAEAVHSTMTKQQLGIKDGQ